MRDVLLPVFPLPLVVLIPDLLVLVLVHGVFHMLILDLVAGSLSQVEHQLLPVQQYPVMIEVFFLLFPDLVLVYFSIPQGLGN